MSPSEKKPVSTRLATAVPGAFGAALLIGAVAFGATSLRSAAEEAAAGRAAQEPPATGAVKPTFGASVAEQRRDAFAIDPRPKPATSGAPKPTEPPKPAEEPTATEAAKPAVQPKPEETSRPQPAPVETKKPMPTEKPAPAPVPAQGTLALQGWADGKKAWLSWSAYLGNGFMYYKVVRSGDTHIEFPTSADDLVVGAIGDAAVTSTADKPPCGLPASYAVFAVTKGNGTYVVLAVSNVVTVTTTCPPPPPTVEVQPIALTVSALPGQGLQLSWQACWRDGFVAYKVVRSGSHADPRFPLNDGTELIAVIGDPNQTGYVDTAVGAGQSWAYRVVGVTKYDGTYVALCESPAVLGTAQ